MCLSQPGVKSSSTGKAQTHAGILQLFSSRWLQMAGLGFTAITTIITDKLKIQKPGIEPGTSAV